MTYGRFFAMIGTSTLVMFGLMYLNTYLVGHVFFSETRAYMAVLMGAVMAVVMLAFMASMYPSRKVNAAIFGGAVVVFALTLWLVRGQATVEDRSYMRAMIPHHSIAIMTSTRAGITDARVRMLADDITYAQDKEIAEMRYLIADVGANGEAGTAPSTPPAELVSAEDALASEVVGKVDPEFLTSGDIQSVLEGPAACRFSYTADSPPVLVTGTADEGAVMKISGDLVRLDGGGETFSDGPLTASIRPADDGMTDLIVSAGADYEAGFRGTWSCDG